MRRFGYTNELKRLTRAEFDREVARKAAKVDAVIAWAALIGLAVLMVWQMVEKAA
jgi:hypothetical protein